MKKQLFNTGWKLQKGILGPFEQFFGAKAPEKEVTLPHDAMIEEKRDPACESGTQTGFYPTKSYTYLKELDVPADWDGDTVLLEFEGVMQKAMVYLNGEFLGGHSYGYTGFTVDLTPSLRCGQKNLLKVLAIGQEKASRWYTGMGIYRDVYLWRGKDVFFPPRPVQVTTEAIENGYATVRLDIQVENKLSRYQQARVNLRLTAPDGVTAAEEWAAVTLGPGETSRFPQRLTVENPKLWSPEHPDLYTWKVELWDGDTLLDSAEGPCGIRTLRLDARRGLQINGETVKLRGACVHHDNGVIGAVSLYDAEVYKLKGLKAAGFNAIRCAHHPAGEALLRACDTVGILVMDELADMWNDPKNPHDFSLDFAARWEDEVSYMTKKDYNHPCVVLYSTGNEIPEIGNRQGTAMQRKIAWKFRESDSTRFTTCAINGYLAVSDAILSNRENHEKKDQTGTGGNEALNDVMGGSEQELLDNLSVSPLLTGRVEPAVGSVDVAGYNYLTARHELEHQNHPHRVVVGSETFPPEIGTLWPIVEQNGHVIGDFTWTGWDYLGEAGIGIFHYGEIKGQGWYPDRLAYCGDITLNGYRRPVSYLREIAFGLRKAPAIAVERLEVYGKQFDKNNWKYVDALDSWTYPGWEGKPAKVYVLAQAEEVELFLNGRSLGRKPVGKEAPLTAIFELTYEPGELKAVAYQDGEVIGESSVSTAGEAAALQVEVSQEVLAPVEGLSFLTVDLVDQDGRPNRRAEKEISVTVEGAGTLLGFGSGAPSTEGSYQSTTWPTFDGRVMAAVRAGEKPGKIKVTFSAPGCPDVRKVLIVTDDPSR